MDEGKQSDKEVAPTQAGNWGLVKRSPNYCQTPVDELHKFVGSSKVPLDKERVSMP